MAQIVDLLQDFTFTFKFKRLSASPALHRPTRVTAQSDKRAGQTD